jgi:hypothetical protein
MLGAVSMNRQCKRWRCERGRLAPRARRSLPHGATNALHANFERARVRSRTGEVPLRALVAASVAWRARSCRMLQRYGVTPRDHRREWRQRAAASCDSPPNVGK